MNWIVRLTGDIAHASLQCISFLYGLEQNENLSHIPRNGREPFVELMMYTVVTSFFNPFVLLSTLELVGENGARISPLSRRTLRARAPKDLQYKFRFVPTS